MFKRWFSGRSRSEKVLRSLRSIVAEINAREPAFQALSDTELQQKTVEFKQRLAQGEPLDSLLVEAFATVREASRRVLGMRHFDVQLIGGIVLHRGMIAEMKTGEGKTLVASLPVYLNALLEKGVHVVTVNDYLAQRDADHIGQIYRFLGLSVGCIVHDMDQDSKVQAYHSDITYGTNNEFGFDYLRDNMKVDLADKCQRPFQYAIVDEVDSILIDEARTPLIISGPADQASDLYLHVQELIVKLRPEDYEKDEKTKSIAFTDRGYEHVEELVARAGLAERGTLFQPEHTMLVHHLNQALKAEFMYARDVDYIVEDGKVVIIDEFTGRKMKGRRYSDGLHQALEAKEGVQIELENQTLASITFQNYFLMYPKLAGMTGTAATETAEFLETYNLNVVVIPTNVPVIRKDFDDEIYRTFAQKVQAVVAQVKECHSRGQPVLVGTSSIDKSEVFAAALRGHGLRCNVLNARQNEKEAAIVAEAGTPGAITIATNMAGRGTDIKLGGNFESQLAQALRGDETPEEVEEMAQKIHRKIDQDAAAVREAGGLFVVGTERSEDLRIDNQLIGRSGRQGDPGMSKFFISLEDDLMRIFGPNLALLENSLKANETADNEPLRHPIMTRGIAKAQQRVGAQHFDTRKHLLKYAKVLNDQRIAVYGLRDSLMALESPQALFEETLEGVLDHLVQSYGQTLGTPQQDQGRGDLEAATDRLFSIPLTQEFWQEHQSAGGTLEDLHKRLNEGIQARWQNLSGEIDPERRDSVVKTAFLQLLDRSWTDHLNGMEHLRSSIHLQAYGQKDPLNEYKHEAFLMFKNMTVQWRQDVMKALFQEGAFVRPWHGREDSEDLIGLLFGPDSPLGRMAAGDQEEEQNWGEDLDPQELLGTLGRDDVFKRLSGGALGQSQRWERQPVAFRPHVVFGQAPDLRVPSQSVDLPADQSALPSNAFPEDRNELPLAPEVAFGQAWDKDLDHALDQDVSERVGPDGHAVSSHGFNAASEKSLAAALDELEVSDHPGAQEVLQKTDLLEPEVSRRAVDLTQDLWRQILHHQDAQEAKTALGTANAAANSSSQNPSHTLSSHRPKVLEAGGPVADNPSGEAGLTGSEQSVSEKLWDAGRSRPGKGDPESAGREAGSREAKSRSNEGKSGRADRPAAGQAYERREGAGRSAGGGTGDRASAARRSPAGAWASKGEEKGTDRGGDRESSRRAERGLERSFDGKAGGHPKSGADQRDSGSRQWGQRDRDQSGQRQGARRQEDGRREGARASNGAPRDGRSFVEGGFTDRPSARGGARDAKGAGWGAKKPGGWAGKRSDEGVSFDRNESWQRAGSFERGGSIDRSRARDFEGRSNEGRNGRPDLAGTKRALLTLGGQSDNSPRSASGFKRDQGQEPRAKIKGGPESRSWDKSWGDKPSFERRSSQDRSSAGRSSTEGSSNPRSRFSRTDSSGFSGGYGVRERSGMGRSSAGYGAWDRSAGDRPSRHPSAGERRLDSRGAGGPSWSRDGGKKPWNKDSASQEGAGKSSWGKESGGKPSGGKSFGDKGFGGRGFGGKSFGASGFGAKNFSDKGGFGRDSSGKGPAGKPSGGREFAVRGSAGRGSFGGGASSKSAWAKKPGGKDGFGGPKKRP